MSLPNFKTYYVTTVATDTQINLKKKKKNREHRNAPTQIRLNFFWKKYRSNSMKEKINFLTNGITSNRQA